MSSTTPNLGLFKYDTNTDRNLAFNLTTALNNNWDIIDNAITHVDGLPDQTDKAGYVLTTDGTEASWGETQEVHCVVETYQNGTSWYRVYSDGWCEQGGYITNTSDTYIKVTLLKSYPDTNYNIQITINTANEAYSSNASPCYFSASYKTKNSFQCRGYSNTSLASKNWVAYGYIGV